MKKVILLLLTILSYSACTQAQIIETDSKMRTVIQEPEKPKSPRFTYFTAKVGGGLFSDGYGESTCPSANIELGVMRKLNDRGLYFGGKIGGLILSVYDPAIDHVENDSFIFRIGPTLGLIKPLKDNLDFDGHIGIAYGYSHSITTSYFNAELGAGVWYNKYFVGIEFQEYLYDSSQYGILLNLGIRF